MIVWSASPRPPRFPAPPAGPVDRRSQPRRPAPSATIALALAVAVVVAAGCHPAAPTANPSAPASPPGPAGTPGQPAAPSVTVAEPIPHRLADWDEFNGRLAAPETVEVRARVSGYLDKVHFREGSVVEAGTLLFTIDPRPYQATVERATAELSRARHQAELATAEAQRAASLFATRAISTDDRDRRVQAAAEAADAVHAAEATLAAARLDLEFTQVRSPIAGRTSTARVTAGNLVSGGSSSATLLTTVVSVDPVYCYLDVDERSALRYRALQRQGQRASDQGGTLPAWMGLADEEGFPRAGRIDFGDNQLSPETGSLRLRAVFPNPDGAAAPGFFARIRIPAGSEYDALLIRDAAIGMDQGHPYVLLVDGGGSAVYRPVELGPKIEGLRVVRRGLAATDRVIVNGLMSVRPGLKVTATLASMRPAPVTNTVPATGRP